MIDRGRVAWKGKQERTNANTDGRTADGRRGGFRKVRKGTDRRRASIIHVANVLGQVISIGSLLCWPRPRVRWDTDCPELRDSCRDRLTDQNMVLPRREERQKGIDVGGGGGNRQRRRQRSEIKDHARARASERARLHFVDRPVVVVDSSSFRADFEILDVVIFFVKTSSVSVCLPTSASSLVR